MNFGNQPPNLARSPEGNASGSRGVEDAGSREITAEKAVGLSEGQGVDCRGDTIGLGFDGESFWAKAISLHLVGKPALVVEDSMLQVGYSIRLSQTIGGDEISQPHHGIIERGGDIDSDSTADCGISVSVAGHEGD